MFKCDKVGDINELRRHIDANHNPNRRQYEIN